MSVDLSKIGYAAIVADASGPGVVVSKVGYGAIVADGSAGVNLSKIAFGIIVGPLSQTNPHRQMGLTIN